MRPSNRDVSCEVFVLQKSVLTFILVAQLPAHHSGIQGVPVPSITDSSPHSIAAHFYPPLCPVSPSSQTNVTIIAWWV